MSSGVSSEILTVYEKDFYQFELYNHDANFQRKFKESYIDEEKQTRNWSNDLVGRVLFLDKYTAEDCQEFQGMEFEVIDGYYFNEGFCTKIKTQVEVIFNKRLEAKNNGNTGLANAYKLLLNSSYGKLIQKTPTTDIKYIEKDAIKLR